MVFEGITWLLNLVINYEQSFHLCPWCPRYTNIRAISVYKTLTDLTLCMLGNFSFFVVIC